jgi:DNA polymerase III alpha subunit
MSPTINYNDNYAVRFGMGAIKGVGQEVATIVQNRKDGKYKSVLIWPNVSIYVRPIKALKT